MFNAFFLLYWAIISVMGWMIMAEQSLQIFQGNSNITRLVKSLSSAENSAAVLSTLLKLIPNKKILSKGFATKNEKGDYDFKFNDTHLMDMLYNKNGSKLLTVSELEVSGGNFPVPLGHHSRLGPQRRFHISAIESNKTTDKVSKKSGLDFMNLLMGLSQGLPMGSNLFSSLTSMTKTLQPSSETPSNSLKLLSTTVTNPDRTENSVVMESHDQIHHQQKRRTDNNFDSATVSPIEDKESLKYIKDSNNMDLPINYEPNNEALKDDSPSKIMNEEYTEVNDQNKSQTVKNIHSSQSKIKFFKTGTYPGLLNSKEGKIQGSSQLDLYNVKNRPFYITSENELNHNVAKEPSSSDAVPNLAQYGQDGYLHPQSSNVDLSSDQNFDGYNNNMQGNQNNYNQGVPSMFNHPSEEQHMENFASYGQPHQFPMENENQHYVQHIDPSNMPNFDPSSLHNQYIVDQSDPNSQQEVENPNQQEGGNNNQQEIEGHHQQETGINTANDQSSVIHEPYPHSLHNNFASPPYNTADQPQSNIDDQGRVHIQGQYVDRLPPDSMYPPSSIHAALPAYQDQSNGMFSSQNHLNYRSPEPQNIIPHNNHITGYSGDVNSTREYITNANSNPSMANKNIQPTPIDAPQLIYHETNDDNVKQSTSLSSQFTDSGEPDSEKSPTGSVIPSSQVSDQSQAAYDNIQYTPGNSVSHLRQNNEQGIFDDIKSLSGGRYSPYLTQSGYAQSRGNIDGPPEENMAPAMGGNILPQEEFFIPSSDSETPSGEGYDTFQIGENQRIPYSDSSSGDENFLDEEYMSARSNHQPGLEATSWRNPQNSYASNNPLNDVSQHSHGIAAQSSNIMSKSKPMYNSLAGQASYVQSSNFGTQFSGYPKIQQPPASKSYQTNGIIGVNVKCNLNRNELIFTVHFKNKFFGLVYTKGYYKVEQCRTRGHGSQTVSLVLPLDGCGNSIVSQGWDLSSGVTTFISRLVIIFDTILGIITSHDTAYKATCTLGGAGAPALESGIQVPMLLPHGMQPTSMTMPPAWMSIVQGKDPQAPPSQILNLGQIGTVVIKLHDTQGHFDIYAFNCFAHDGMGMGRIQLLDFNGCPIHTQIVGPQSREVSHGSLSIFFHFKVFKFPDVNNVYFVCEIKICYKKCQQPNCGLFSASKHRKKRNLEELFSPIIWHHELNDTSHFNITNENNGTLNNMVISHSKLNDTIPKDESLHNQIANAIDGVKTSTIFQSILVKIPMEQEDEYLELKSKSDLNLVSQDHKEKQFSHESEDDILSNDVNEIPSKKDKNADLNHDLVRKMEKKEVCISKTTFATSLGFLFTLIIIVATISFYFLTKKQMKKMSSKLSSFDNSEYYENGSEKDSKHILSKDYGSWRSPAAQKNGSDKKPNDISNKNTFPLRLHPIFVYKS
ncbi:unnamed protein product [Gordionus sp. m RMFG-2023]|uniref:uncharacterized protein LOC135930834 n=1 Tax=Gordionus sp. m RMFG-2023 TaxID=3053472 RepID=UPI0030DE1286